MVFRKVLTVILMVFLVFGFIGCSSEKDDVGSVIAVPAQDDVEVDDEIEKEDTNKDVLNDEIIDDIEIGELI